MENGQSLSLSQLKRYNVNWTFKGVIKGFGSNVRKALKLVVSATAFMAMKVIKPLIDKYGHKLRKVYWLLEMLSSAKTVSSEN